MTFLLILLAVIGLLAYLRLIIIETSSITTNSYEFSIGFLYDAHTQEARLVLRLAKFELIMKGVLQW